MTQSKSDRIETAELLPFWVNGSLQPSEALQIEAAMAFDSDLRAEAEALKRLRDTIQAGTPAFSPGELGWVRLQRAIAQEPRQHIWQKRVIAAAALVATLALIGIYMVSPRLANAPDTFRQASGQSSSRILTVSFRSGATEAAIADVLLRNGLIIVDGPSALRLYRIEVGKNQDPAMAAMALRSETGIFETVELSE